MLIYGVSGIFAYKKTIKQFLQPMIEQVLGGGGGGWGCAARMCHFFASVFQSYCIFVSVIFNSPMPFFGSILPIFEYFFAVYYVYSSKSQTVF